MEMEINGFTESFGKPVETNKSVSLTVMASSSTITKKYSMERSEQTCIALIQNLSL